MPGELRVHGIVTQEEASGDRKPGIADDVGIAEETGEAVPVREFELPFGSIDDGFAEGYRETDGGVEDLVVVGEVVYVAAEICGIEAELIEEALGGTEFEVVAMGRLDREAEDVWGSTR